MNQVTVGNYLAQLGHGKGKEDACWKIRLLLEVDKEQEVELKKGGKEVENNLLLELKLNEQEKKDLVAFMRAVGS